MEVFDNVLLSLLDKVVSCLEKGGSPTASRIRKQFSATWRKYRVAKTVLN